MLNKKDQLIAARDRLNNSVKLDYENGEEMVILADSYLNSQDIDTIRSLLDSHINSPDLSELKREVYDVCCKVGESEILNRLDFGIVSRAIDHLAPWIVREGMVQTVCRGGDVIDQRLITLEVPADFKITIGANYLISSAQKKEGE